MASSSSQAVGLYLCGYCQEVVPQSATTTHSRSKHPGISPAFFEIGNQQLVSPRQAGPSVPSMSRSSASSSVTAVRAGNQPGSSGNPPAQGSSTSVGIGGGSFMSAMQRLGRPVGTSRTERALQEREQRRQEAIAQLTQENLQRIAAQTSAARQGNTGASSRPQQRQGGNGGAQAAAAPAAAGPQRRQGGNGGAQSPAAPAAAGPQQRQGGNDDRADDGALWVPLGAIGWENYEAEIAEGVRRMFGRRQ